MKIDIHTEDKNEEIILSSDVFAVGLECNGIKVVNGIDTLFSNISAERKDFILSDDSIFTVITYTSEDESLQKIMKKYRGLRLLELSVKNVNITVTA